ncbi:MAG: MSHA biogenesis protein MshD [Alteromonadaceae bacterium]|nr:MAG: MSHA biogenesis protein MshD [Alteromonadaceae bacterium]
MNTHAYSNIYIHTHSRTHSYTNKVIFLYSVKKQQGVTLIETIVFLVVVSIALGAVMNVFSTGVVNSVDPVVRSRALSLAQAQLDDILSRSFDENSPAGGIPACDSTLGLACAGIAADADFDDVGDYNGFVNNSDPNHTLTVSVVNASFAGVLAAQARLITIQTSMPDGDVVTISAYKTNF